MLLSDLHTGVDIGDDEIPYTVEIEDITPDFANGIGFVIEDAFDLDEVTDPTLVVEPLWRDLLPPPLPSVTPLPQRIFDQVLEDAFSVPEPPGSTLVTNDLVRTVDEFILEQRRAEEARMLREHEWRITSRTETLTFLTVGCTLIMLAVLVIILVYRIG